MVLPGMDGFLPFGIYDDVLAGQNVVALQLKAELLCRKIEVSRSECWISMRKPAILGYGDLAK